MAKDSQRLEEEFIATVHEKTGKTLQEWMSIIDTSGLDKPNAILKWLKDNHHLNHLQANFLSGIYLNNGEPVFNHEKLFEKLFVTKENLRPLYQSLQQAISNQLADAEFIPTKAYISIEAKRCFACATLTKNNIRVGLDLGDLPFDAYTQKAKSLGAMPNLTHMVEITSTEQIDDKLINLVQVAYNRTHQI